MAQYALGKAWDRATSAEREAFLAAFEDAIVAPPISAACGIIAVRSCALQERGRRAAETGWLQAA
jgi:hypothetical protein